MIKQIFPFVIWLKAINRPYLKADFEAGFIGAVLVLPQAIALATLAGMPPQYGIYASVIPVIIAALWCSSWHSVSGPNTALCVLIAFSVAPFANPGSTEYIGFVLILTLMVGIIQLFVGMLRLGSVLDFISHTVISAIVLSVGLITIIAASSSFIGVLSNFGEPFFIRVYQLFHDIPHANLFSLSVGIVTLLVGLLSRLYWRRYSLVIALIAGSICTLILNANYGSATTNIEMIGNLSISLWPFQIPNIDLEDTPIILQLISSAFAIAFLGLMQSVVISRSIAINSNQRIQTNQEIIGQGLSNTIGAFFSSFASSGSFNRSAANYAAGAKTPLAAIVASILLVLFVINASSMIAFMPLPVVAGILMLVGIGLIDMKEIKRAMLSKQESLIFFSTLMVALIFGLNSGVFVGVLLSLISYLWKASTPNISINEHDARDGRLVAEVTISGNLFFGSLRYVEKILSNIDKEGKDKMIILLRTDHLTFVDVPAAIMLVSEAKRWTENGNWFYLYVVNNPVLSSIKKSGLLNSFEDQYIIYHHLDHPMKEIIYPSKINEISGFQEKTSNNIIKGLGINMKNLAKRLRMTRLIGPLSLDQFNELLKNCEIKVANAGDLLCSEHEAMNHHIILLEGELESQRIWHTEDKKIKTFTKKIVTPKNISGGFAYLNAISKNIRVRAITDIQYILIDGSQIDEMLGWNEQVSLQIQDNPELIRRVEMTKKTRVFQQLPISRVIEACKKMFSKTVAARDVIVTQGDKGDCFYILKEGEAEVWQTDPFTDETALKVTLGPGDSFGEEAILQDAFRNATVAMTTPGELFCLEKSDFDTLVKPHFVEEIDPPQAVKMIKYGQAKLLDCRYDMEFEDSRIPGATHISLDRTRWDIHQLDPNELYIVYCRSGKRSKAAAFLLNERNVKTLSLKGGIQDWPYEIDESVIETEIA